MADGTTAFLEGTDGQRMPVAPGTGRALGALLGEPTLRAWLQDHGLPVAGDARAWRVRVQDLRQVLGRAARELDQAPPEIQDHPLFREDAPLQIMARLSAVAGEAEIGVERDPASVGLRIVPRPTSARDIILQMDQVPPDRAGEMLEALDALVGDLDLPDDLLLRTLTPLLFADGSAGVAARILGRAGVAAAREPLERALSRARSVDDRLEILAAMMRLGHRALGLRTLRSILVHGSPDARRRAVDVLCDVGEPGDADAIHDMLRLAPDRERPLLASLLYRIGDMRGYRVLSRAVEQLGPQTESHLIQVVLQAIAGTRSRRFVPPVAAYAERETRRWFAARARRVASELDRYGADEAPPDRLVDLAEQAYFANRRDDATDLLTEVLALDPNHAHALYLKANCLKEEGSLSDALSVSGRALAAEPFNWRVHRLRGSLLWDSGRHEAALEAYNRALKHRPTDPYTWYYKGYVLYRLQRYEEALPCLDRALSLKSDSPYIYNQKAFCLERLGRHLEAVACYRRSLRLNPGDIYTREYLGQSLQAAGRLEEALAQLEAVLREDATREEALYRRADVLYDLERWEDSAAAFAAYLEHQPQSYNAWFNQGLCCRFLGRFAEGTRCFERALELRPQSANARRHLEFCQSR